MTGMTWEAVEVYGQAGSWCEFSLGADLKKSTMDARLEADGTWSWELSLYASDREHWATGDGCATEGKARFMAMSLASALLQIIDGVKPHEVD
jgi:hypothetical protein